MFVHIDGWQICLKVINFVDKPPNFSWTHLFKHLNRFLSLKMLEGLFNKLFKELFNKEEKYGEIFPTISLPPLSYIRPTSTLSDLSQLPLEGVFQLFLRVQVPQQRA